MASLSLHPRTCLSRRTLGRAAGVLLLLSILAAALAQPNAAHAATITVNSAADTAAPDGECTLREAITNAESDSDTTAGDCMAGLDADTIGFDANYIITVGSQLPVVNTTMTINGNGQANTIIQASACNPITPVGHCTPATYRVLEVGDTANLTLNGLTIRHGSCADSCEVEAYSGGGIYSHGSLTLSYVTISDNSATDYGGGMFDSSSSPTLSRVTFSGNSAGYGGGMYSALSSPTMTFVIFSGNSAVDGGGLFNGSSSPTMTHVTFNSINSATANGGGMYNFNSSPIVTDAFFEANSAVSGGGLFNSGSSPILTEMGFHSNSATYGGGMANLASSSPTVTNVAFSGNTAVYGGGMYNDGSSPTLIDVTFNNDNSANYGGGMANYASSSPTLTNVTFSGNSAAIWGGGMYNDGSSPTLTNVTFSGNSSDDTGGGMYNGASSPTLTNVTFSGNSAVDVGGAMANYDGSSPSLTNTLMANSVSGGDCWPVLTLDAASSNNLVEDSIDACGLTNGVNGNIVGQDPMLGALANNGGRTQTMALGAGSPAINSGDEVSCPADDQRGVTRPQGSACDIGAFEAPVTLTFRSRASQDGWVLESGQNTDAGGSMNVGDATLRVGDDAARKQYRAILSFNTKALPDNATILSVKLKFKRDAAMPANTNPVSLLQGFMLDVKKGFFGSSSSLQLVDFKAAAGKTVGPYSPALSSSGYYTIKLPGSTFAQINKLATKGGLTQIRLRFMLDDNNNGIANFLDLVSGNHATVSKRPALIIVYTTP